MTDPDFLGMRLTDFAAERGQTEAEAKAWLASNCYWVNYVGRIAPRTLPSEVERRINERLAALPPSSPCFRCGARGPCQHPRAIAA